MKKTYVIKAAEIKPEWHFVNADGQILGKVATQVAKILMGKTDPRLAPNVDLCKKVVVTNAEKVILTGKKMTDKKYIHYTGFPGGLKVETAEKLMARRPTEVLKKAVKGMLSKNKLRDIRMTNLYIYAGSQHPHTGQETKKN